MTYKRHPQQSSPPVLPPDLVEKLLGLMGAENVTKLAYAMADLCETRSDEEFSRINLCVVTIMTCRHKNMKLPTSEELCLIAVANGLEPPEKDPDKARHRFALWAMALAESELLFPETPCQS
jgi:hypothetical protein